MIFKSQEVLAKLAALESQVNRLLHEAEMSRAVLTVKEPDAVRAAEAYEGLRKQVVASNNARRSHVAQLAQMAVAVSRATSVDDLRKLVDQWLEQADVVALVDVPEGLHAQDLFETINGARPVSLEEMVIIEPAFVDAQNSVIIRTGRVDQRVSRSGEESRTGDASSDGQARLTVAPAVGALPNEEKAE